MELKKTAKIIEALLKISRRPVGVKLVHSREEFMKYDGITLSRPLSYCVAVKSASLGHSIKIDRKTAGCFGGNRALGLSECDEAFKSGAGGFGLGLYSSPETAAAVADALPRCSPDTNVVIVKPLEYFETDPDVVLLISDTREAMRIFQGYTYTYGLTKGLNISGNQAVCVEATVTPMFTGEMNVTMLCSGTRYKAEWKGSEVICGIPMKKIGGLLSGLKGTVNAVEMDGRKKGVEYELSKLDVLEIVRDYGRTYFATCKKEREL